MEKTLISFATSADRSSTNAEKYTKRQRLFGSDEVIPLWVADMDLDSPSFVLEAIRKRLDHPILGYEEMPRTALEAQAKWLKRHHEVDLDTKDLLYSPSVVASINTAIEAFSSVGDAVVVQTPVYAPFFKSVTSLGREVIHNPLVQKDGIYKMNLEDLKARCDEKTKLLLLCSPHNPVGRVWSEDELNDLVSFCRERHIIIFSDEVHCDLSFAKHTSLLSLAPDIAVCAYGVGKTFNLSGLAISTLAIKDASLLERFLKVYNARHFGFGSSLSHTAFEVAYSKGDAWLELLLDHIKSNYDALADLLRGSPIKLTPLEGTYLAWLDCRALKLSDRELRAFFASAGLGLSAGTSFGREGSGFMRLNLAISKEAMSEVLARLKKALCDG